MDRFIELVTFSNVTTAMLIVNFILVIGLILVERKNPDSTLAWALVLMLLPVVGIVLYLVFSQNIARMQIFRLTADEREYNTNAVNKQIKAIEEKQFEYIKDETRDWEELVKLNLKYGSDYLTQHNTISILNDGVDMFESLKKDIRNAKKYINIEYFIIKWDEVGRELIELLTEKAKQGVEVRLLMDAMGSRKINHRRIKPLLDAGGKVGFFFKPKLKVIMMRINYRNHRKLVVIDDEIGYIGGFNIAREYLGLKEKFGYWRDTHLRIEGEAITDINARFVLDWRYVSNEIIDIKEILKKEIVNEGNSAVQIVTSGPDTEKEQIKRAYMKMITFADDHVYLQTPYFVPDASIQESLKMAALSGVDVRVMIPCMPDHIFVYWATYSYVGELLRSGVRVFIYDNGFLHAKTLCCDGMVASIGSANFDNRSFRLNFEANAFVYDKDIAEKMDVIFEEDMKHCHELTQELYDKRSVWIKVKEGISRLLSAVL
ncbi:MAG: cardiolipin synthase [Clostridiales bacterium]|nr:cardiolipin synthase [Clostridiales bacterium]MDY5975279.1 cardiolipin synthase [Anaerovoracaceae bacterium]